jgi:hypothetical protein
MYLILHSTKEQGVRHGWDHKAYLKRARVFGILLFRDIGMKGGKGVPGFREIFMQSHKGIPQSRSTCLLLLLLLPCKLPAFSLEKMNEISGIYVLRRGASLHFQIFARKDSFFVS